MADRAAWLRVLSQVVDRKGDVGLIPCPECGQNRLEIRYIVKLETRIGYVLLWCGACLHGISVSRVRAPEGAPTWSIEDPASVEGVPDFARRE
ncbi:hypothetical protein [Actinacidiphila guanduensis]|jgi:hypothetical protein|uniref:Uncharacterized protein n=1 Tax=Actinacidiphila guanduensis TaxID=310781 RepID=A0A1H0NRM7_9ACTN|nr:hypothetical protein [Actinacidiphila guanduensis]SDO95281.1 hypothetical protein SAMN05216259_114162 [Actinacidiphila guanduensis]